MKIIYFIICILIPLVVCNIGYAENDLKCHMCGMDASRSQTEFMVEWNDGSREHACCLHCVYLLQNFVKDRKISKLETRDFTTGSFIDAMKAYYLEGSSIIPKDSMAPFLLAFPDKETAEKYAKQYKGNILTFKESMESVAKFDEEVSAQ
jgi:hypothetical protein